LPNKLLGFIALPQLGEFLEMMNEIWGCKIPGCKGNLVPFLCTAMGWVAPFVVVMGVP
jgi:hypothetical protein